MGTFNIGQLATGVDMAKPMGTEDQEFVQCALVVLRAMIRGARVAGVMHPRPTAEELRAEIVKFVNLPGLLDHDELTVLCFVLGDFLQMKRLIKPAGAVQ